MPLAIDTNVLLRVLVDDGSDQCRVASERLSKQRIFVTASVLMETEWVLRSRVRLASGEITVLFKLLASYENVEFDDAETVAWAIGAHESGFDFADAIHIHAAKHCEAFLTFDKPLIKKAGKMADFVTVEAP